MSETQTWVTGDLANDGNLLMLGITGAFAYPVSGGFPNNTALLSPGDLYCDGGCIGVVPGVTPDPTAKPPSFPGVTPQQLLDFGGGNLPLSPSPYGNLWNNNGAVCISDLSNSQVWVTGYFINDGGILMLAFTGKYLYPILGGYPNNTALLSPGDLYYDGGYIGVVPGTTPDPNVIPPSFPGVTPQQLLDFGGKNIPWSPGPIGTLWNNGRAVCVGSSPIKFETPWATLPASLQKTINSYLYWEYRDDDNLQGFVDAYNKLTQTYVDWFNVINLPVYTMPQISGTLLDWVATGLYGQPRPVFSTGSYYQIGPLDTATLNQIGLNQTISIGNDGYYQASDDIYKRVLTWNFFKGDGNNFTVFWLKRRIARFLAGANGTAPNVDFMPGVSVSFGTCLVYLSPSTYQVGPFDTQTIGSIALNGTKTMVESGRYVLIDNTINITIAIALYGPVANALKSAILGGIVQLPFQFKFTVTIV